MSISKNVHINISSTPALCLRTSTLFQLSWFDENQARAKLSDSLCRLSLIYQLARGQVSVKCLLGVITCEVCGRDGPLNGLSLPFNLLQMTSAQCRRKAKKPNDGGES